MPTDILELGLASNDFPCQMTDWIPHFLVTFWKSLSLLGGTIALSCWVGKKGWEPLACNYGSCKWCFFRKCMICGFGGSRLSFVSLVWMEQMTGAPLPFYLGQVVTFVPLVHVELLERNIGRLSFVPRRLHCPLSLWCCWVDEFHLGWGLFCSWLSFLVLPCHLLGSGSILEAKGPKTCKWNGKLVQGPSVSPLLYQNFPPQNHLFICRKWNAGLGIK